MIWFACKQCGRKHNRPENSAGSLIFCNCGQSLTVPWESTTEEPDMVLPIDPPAQPLPPLPRGPGAPPTGRGPGGMPLPPPGGGQPWPPAEPWSGWPPATPPVPTGPSRPAPFGWAPGEGPPAQSWGPGGVPPAPRLVPVPVGEERYPVPPRRPGPPGGPPYPQRYAQPMQRDRNFCFNHQNLEVERTCESCAERFCAHCLVTFQGKLLCGPCKNALIRTLDEPPKTSALAVTSALLGVVLSLGGFCLVPLGAALDILPLIIFILLCQLGTLGMGALAVYRTEKTSLLRGKSLAYTAVLASSIGILLTVAATLYSYLQGV